MLGTKTKKAARPDQGQTEIAQRVRTLADQAFSRAAGAPLIEGNRVRRLRNAAENYPAWLEAIRGARRHVHFENYIIQDDAAGKMFAEALLEKAQDGVAVRVIYDWLGAVGKTSGGFWSRLRAGGVDVRCYNPPRFDSPLGWLSRDHRKTLAVDGEVGFVAGLCVGQQWLGFPEKKIDPWRDTGVEVRGPAVVDIERAFATVWSMLGEALPADEILDASAAAASQGPTSVRIVATEPSTSRAFRLDQLFASFARQRVWLTDAYYAGTATYVQGLTTAARQGVDVRILLPGVTDLPMVRSLSRSGYKPLLECGVRIFEWNGPMLHAKSAVVDSRWSRVGSTNLNLASWLGNCEMDAVIEDADFARQMEEMYLQDLANATEVVLNQKRKVRAPKSKEQKEKIARGRGSASRAAVGAARIGHAVGAAIADRRTIEPLESRLMVITGLILLPLAVLFAIFPAALAYPLVAILTWIALALLIRGWKARRKRLERGE
ncbi:MAG TPA: phospholipase D-like domain-containing protein [Opitutaceae bacterium]|nr:phospholipase D-like domain-containing protein [Opitutaceae bacterium]